MQFDKQELEKLKSMFRYLIEKKEKESGGHNGFCLLELIPVLDEMTNENTITKRETPTRTIYFLTKN